MLPFNVRVWFYRQPIDFRKQIDGLVILVAVALQKEHTSGQLFILRNKNADKLKMLYWEDDVFWIFYKRRETSRHLFPMITDETIELSPQQLQWLLSCLDFSRKQALDKARYTHFY